MPLDVAFIGAYSLRTFGGGVKWFIKLLNLLQSDGRIRPHLFVQDYVDYPRLERRHIKKMVCFDYHEIPRQSGQLLPLSYRSKVFSASSLTSNIFEAVYVMADRPHLLQKAMNIGERIIFGAHDPYLLHLNGQEKRRFEELWRNVDAIHVLSPAQYRFSRYNPNLCSLPNTWLGQPAPVMKKFSKFTVLFFSRHEKEKGIDILHQVAKALPEDIDLYVAGSGTKTHLISEVRRSNIHLLGFLPEEQLYAYIARSHAVLFPSRWESGLAMVAVEALAHYTPLVYRDMVENWILKRHPLNVAAVSDKEFLEAILHLKNLFETDRHGYLRQCSELSRLLESSRSYLENFISLLTDGPSRS